MSFPSCIKLPFYLLQALSCRLLTPEAQFLWLHHSPFHFYQSPEPPPASFDSSAQLHWKPFCISWPDYFFSLTRDFSLGLLYPSLPHFHHKISVIVQAHLFQSLQKPCILQQSRHEHQAPPVTTMLGTFMYTIHKLCYLPAVTCSHWLSITADTPKLLGVYLPRVWGISSTTTTSSILFLTRISHLSQPHYQLPTDSNTQPLPFCPQVFLIFSPITYTINSITDSSRQGMKRGTQLSVTFWPVDPPCFYNFWCHLQEDHLLVPCSELTFLPSFRIFSLWCIRQKESSCFLLYTPFFSFLLSSQWHQCSGRQECKSLSFLPPSLFFF